MISKVPSNTKHSLILWFNLHEVYLRWSFENFSKLFLGFLFFCSVWEIPFRNQWGKLVWSSGGSHNPLFSLTVWCAHGTSTASYPQEGAALLPEVEEISDLEVSVSFQHGCLPVIHKISVKYALPRALLGAIYFSKLCPVKVLINTDSAAFRSRLYFAVFSYFFSYFFIYRNYKYSTSLQWAY